MDSEIKCRFCKSKNFTKQGYRITKSRGKIQKYYCRDCKKYFIVDNGFINMRNDPKTITLSIDIYLSNLSSRKMRNQLKRHFGIKVSHVSVLQWVRKYVMKVYRFVEGLCYKVGSSFYADETMIRRQKEDDLFWACVDWDTRMITGTHYSITGNIQEAKKFLNKSISKGKPNFIQTDGAQFYGQAFKKLFYSNKIGGLTVEHKIQNYQQTRVHNYKIETVFMKIKDRVRAFRGLKALWSAPILLCGLVIQHNFIEEHTSKRTYPCVLAGQDLKLGEDRWLGLIQLAQNYI